MTNRGLQWEQQLPVEICYKDQIKTETLRCDLLVEATILIELKAVDQIAPIHKAQLLSYMRIMQTPTGLLINFNQSRLIDGISRLYLPSS